MSRRDAASETLAPRREHFIPLRKRDLVSLLAGRETAMRDDDRRQFLDLCRLLEATFHFEYHQRLDDLKDAYAPFDPDADTLPGLPLSPEGRQASLQTLFDRFQTLLERANFRRLTRREIEEALQSASDWGVNLHIDFDIFERLEVFVRGDVVDRRTRRRAANLWRSQQVDVRVYRRLVVIFRLRDGRHAACHADSESVYLKIFKDIPHDDIEMLLPGTRVRMTLLDQAKIWLPTLSGLVLALVKIAKGALMLAFAGLYGLLGFLGLLGGTIGYGVKSFLGFLRTKDKYQLNLTRNLYYQNLDNNAGVLCRLLDEAEEQEFRETVLAWFLLWRDAPAGGWTQDELDRAAEAFLAEAVGLQVDFEVDDAAAKLLRLGMAERSADGRLRAVEIRAALEHLDRLWDNAFPYNRPEPGTVPIRRAG